MTLSRRSAFALLGVSVLAGCAEPVDFTPEEHRTPTTEGGTEPPEVVVESTFLARSTEGRHVDVPGATPIGLVFSTPHFDGRIGSVFIGETLPYEIAEQVERMNPLRAPEGHVFVAFTAQAGQPEFQESSEYPVTVSLIQAGTTVPLRNLFGGFTQDTYAVPWEFIVACVPEGEALMLEVTDSGKTIQLDLVQGVPTVDEAWNANQGFRERQQVAFSPEDAVFERDFTTSPPEGYESETGTFRIGFQPSGAYIGPWSPTHDWAPQGSQWLTIPMAARVEYQGVPANIELDLPGSFTYLTADGQAMELVTPQTITTEEVLRQHSDIIPTFEITGRDDQATLTFSANGTVRVDYQEVTNVPANFSSAADAIVFDLTYSSRPDRFGG